MSLVRRLRRTANRLIDTGLSFLPARTVEHLGNASTELCRAARVLIDQQIVWNARHVANAEQIRRDRAAAKQRRRAEARADTFPAEAPSRPD